ncbi:uncharacterized protein F4807DRAFT_85361 [Annulohypoxylon truncatum]|uniref:uncharacterized protein n=1 Tax=Annulohypoxylon truncatum TaxID=327061 RepID=UPI0020078761|nr:uncharacterized protein F4807DRAFT_85361 [Annulohypoxylon truncatum]KAI1209659.1 hypothetical protein F4807DRAFT_85361 [Annulohypoxylon truncatum]
MEIRLTLANGPSDSTDQEALTYNPWGSPPIVPPKDDEESTSSIYTSDALDTPTTTITETQWPRQESLESEAPPVIMPSSSSHDGQLKTKFMPPDGTDGACYLRLFGETWRSDLFSRKETWALGSELLEEDVDHREKEIEVGLWPVYSDEGRRRSDRVHVGEPEYAPVAGTPAHLLENWRSHCFLLGINPALVRVGGGSVNPTLDLPNIPSRFPLT